ncbi:hypothetical protein V1477_007322 [Vespula maculifrons]|uniref:Uncharacterized protein n=1 Tax=Vespula maculifrons TaxID=7453 RepID=A0ABD2CI78_VESMC
MCRWLKASLPLESTVFRLNYNHYGDDENNYASPVCWHSSKRPGNEQGLIEYHLQDKEIVFVT